MVVFYFLQGLNNLMKGQELAAILRALALALNITHFGITEKEGMRGVTFKTYPMSTRAGLSVPRL